MVELFVFDGHELPPRDTLRHYFPPACQRELNLRKALKSIKLPQSFLVRNIFDLNKNNFGGIEKLIRNCLENGHDRTEEEECDNGGFTIERVKDRRGLKSSDLIWAVEYRCIDNVKRYFCMKDLMAEYGDAFSEGFFVFDKSMYNEERNTLYFQTDIEVRKRALLAMVLFEVNLEKIERQKNNYKARTGSRYHVEKEAVMIKPSLRFSLSLDNLSEIVKEIKEKGYFNHE